MTKFISNWTLFKVKPVIILMTQLVVFYVRQQTIRLSETVILRDMFRKIFK